MCLMQPFPPDYEHSGRSQRKKDDPHRTSQHLSPTRSSCGPNSEIAGAVKEKRDFKASCEFIGQPEHDAHDRRVDSLEEVAVREAEQERGDQGGRPALP